MTVARLKNYLLFVILVCATLACATPVTVARSNGAIARPTLEGSAVTVTAQTVNIRTADGIASGMFAEQGDVLTVTFRPDGYAVISAPPEWSGMLIWRGCTSDNGGYGCEAK